MERKDINYETCYGITEATVREMEEYYAVLPALGLAIGKN